MAKIYFLLEAAVCFPAALVLGTSSTAESSEAGGGGEGSEDLTSITSLPISPWPPPAVTCRCRFGFAASTIREPASNILDPTPLREVPTDKPESAVASLFRGALAAALDGSAGLLLGFRIWPRRLNRDVLVSGEGDCNALYEEPAPKSSLG